MPIRRGTIHGSEVTVSRIQQVKCKVRDMVFNATVNIISIIISWRSVLLVEETAVSGESHTVVSSTTILAINLVLSILSTTNKLWENVGV
jgi:hypothetical protein